MLKNYSKYMIYHVQKVEPVSLSLSHPHVLFITLSQRRHELPPPSLSFYSLIPGSSAPYWFTPSPLPFPYFFLFNPFLRFFLNCLLCHFFYFDQAVFDFRYSCNWISSNWFFLWLGFLVCVLSLINFGEGSVLLG